MSSQVSAAYVGRQISSSAASLLGIFIGKAFLLWPSEVTKGLKAFWGQTAACQLLMSPTGGQGSIFKMSWLLPRDKRAYQCEGMPGPEGPGCMVADRNSTR